MRKRTIIKILMACGFLLSPLTSWAEQQAKITINISGTLYEFYLEDKPVITFQNNVLEIKSDKNTGVTVDAKDIGDFNFVHSSTTGIENIEMNPNATFGSKISGLTPGSKVIVATADGKVIMSQNVSENGKAEVDFTHLPAGILVLKTEKGAIKIKN